MPNIEPHLLLQLQADRCLQECNRHSVSNILWGLSNSGTALPTRLLKNLETRWAAHALDLIADGSKMDSHWGQNVALILLSFSRLRLDPLEGK